MGKFRIHGDNIVECERLAKLIINKVHPTQYNISLISPSTILYSIDFNYCNKTFHWDLELLPGFNKSGRHRWEGNIFNALSENGSFLEETPDAIVTKISNDDETILFAVEFCSALQAGNQAWQRSGRAFSTGLSGCPYLYIVDFVKYELDPHTRARKSLRFPNPAVPYSYINFSRSTGNFVAQIYIKSEDFDKNADIALGQFNEDDFAEEELSTYIVNRMCGFDTRNEENEILRKNLNIVLFLANKLNSNSNFSAREWSHLYSSQEDIINYSIRSSRFIFHKIITEKGHHGNSLEFQRLVDHYSTGIASKDLPFGLIPAEERPAFANQLQIIYPSYDPSIISKIARDDTDLIICMIKGFKPRGDDNRPDRGILPLAAMLTSKDTEIMTYIYGPVIGNNLLLLTSSPRRLAQVNGLWKSILSLTNYLALDVPVLRFTINDKKVLLDTTDTKNYYINNDENYTGLTRPAFSNIPIEYHEDDVDTGIHFLFSHILGSTCFEGMCNPPGGDWSGLSILLNNCEYRWLSLPRVSDEVDGKRPDHVIEIFNVLDKPVLLSIESKEKSIDLEHNVGRGLIQYINYLMRFIPSSKRIVDPYAQNWERPSNYVDFNKFIAISAAAYLKNLAESNETVFQNSNCDMLFIMEPTDCGWNIEIVTRTADSEHLKDFIMQRIHSLGNNQINVF